MKITSLNTTLAKTAVHAFKLVILAACCSSCTVNPGPDKSAAGAFFGAGWGSTAGLIIGNQISASGPGALIGGGLGLASGLMTGVGLDMAEGTALNQDAQIASLQVQVAEGEKRLMDLQESLDYRVQIGANNYSGFQVFFDIDKAFLRLGSMTQLQWYADALKSDPYVKMIEVHGHSDDSGDPERNKRLSEARCRTVASFLVSQGISADIVSIKPHGAERPLAANEIETGRQLNRRVEVVAVK